MRDSCRRAFAVTTAFTCLLGAGSAVSAGVAPGVALAGAWLEFHVTTTADGHDANPGDGHCADAAGQCTLRAAVEEADAAPAGSRITIEVPEGTYLLTLGTLTVGSSSAPLDLSVRGNGPGETVVSGGGVFQVVAVPAPATVVLAGLTITGGNAGRYGYGGGVLSSGNLTVRHVAVDGNQAGAGGGVDNAGGTLVVTGSTIAGNSAPLFGGGGIQNGGPQNAPGSVLVVDSTITGNRSRNEGGGIFSGQNGHPAVAGLAAAAARPVCAGTRCAASRVPTAGSLTLTVIDSTVSGNLGGNGGGGIAAEGPAQVFGSAIDDNSAGGAVGGGLFDVGVVRDSTISGNRASSGGGVEAFPGLTMTITTSTLDDNHSASYGGAIDESGSVTISRSTLAGNTSGGQRYLGAGAAVELNGGALLTLSDSTVTDNSTQPVGGGAIDNYGGSATLLFDTFSDNSGSVTGGSYTTATGTIFVTDGQAANCTVPLHETAGFNLADDTSCGLSLATDLVSPDPDLGPLTDNGGPTQTVALLPGSPAIDAGGLPATSGCPSVDQRGQPRPQGSACDIGAFERGQGEQN